LTINSNVNTDVYATPAECHDEEIDLFCLSNNEGRYSFTAEMKQDKFIVFADSEKHAYVRPESVSVNSIMEVDSALSVETVKQKLLNENCNAGCWKALLKYFSICVNNNLPFSTFTILKAISSSSALAAKAFVFFVYSDEQEKFVIEYSKDLEDDLGFHFTGLQKMTGGTQWNGLELAVTMSCIKSQLITHTLILEIYIRMKISIKFINTILAEILKILPR
jgi:hypothetical protein